MNINDYSGGGGDDEDAADDNDAEVFFSNIIISSVCVLCFTAFFGSKGDVIASSF